MATDTLSSVDIAAIEAAAGVPLNKAIETAVRVESLADEIVNINTRDDAAAASRAAKRTKPPPSNPPPPTPPLTPLPHGRAACRGATSGAVNLAVQVQAGLYFS